MGTKRKKINIFLKISDHPYVLQLLEQDLSTLRYENMVAIKIYAEYKDAICE